LMFTTAGNTLATAKTAGSEAGSACAKQDADPARINRLAMNKLSAQSALCARTRANTFLTFIAQPSNEAIFALSTAAGTVAAALCTASRRLSFLFCRTLLGGYRLAASRNRRTFLYAYLN